ncbi:MAG TPA: hypothetical protein VED17_11545 [Nitrososphaerales archaeon]|nr:hypothetical protein [Nitrososphaerales archaeon]
MWFSFRENEFSESPGDVKLRVRRRSLAARKKLCPQCLAELKVATEVSGWLVPTFYYCSKCGYSGYVAFEHAPSDK